MLESVQSVRQEKGFPFSERALKANIEGSIETNWTVYLQKIWAAIENRSARRLFVFLKNWAPVEQRDPKNNAEAKFRKSGIENRLWRHILVPLVAGNTPTHCQVWGQVLVGEHKHKHKHNDKCKHKHYFTTGNTGIKYIHLWHLPLKVLFFLCHSCPEGCQYGDLNFWRGPVWVFKI